MSTTTLGFIFSVGGVATDAAGVVLRDPTGTVGVIRKDTGASVVAAGTPMLRTAPGTYAYAFTDPSPGLQYSYWVEATYGGAVYRSEKLTSELPSPGSAYLSVPEADAIAATLPAVALAAYLAASSADKFAALELASLDIDSVRYQGRRYDPGQALEFPRVLYEDGAATSYYAWQTMGQTMGACPGNVPQQDIADWDPVAGAAVVPQRVLQALIFQANSILDGSREERLAEQHDGVIHNSTSGSSETYDPAKAPGVQTGLDRRALQLVKKYRLAAGRMI